MGKKTPGEKMTITFEKCNRDYLRELFQPSRILLGIVGDQNRSRFNILPLCFHTWCSYEPLLYAIAIDRDNYSAHLFEKASEYTLSIPGESMVEKVLYCGTHSGRQYDKTQECGIQWIDSHNINPPGISTSLANIELSTVARYPVGDHIMVVGEVKTIFRAKDQAERPLLAVGPSSFGFEILAHKGIHTIGVAPTRKS
ncbi:MAG: flavin reductase family protein [Sedimentisphaerales bacterium]|nr:flavin reductase family protein [Sedimentisphaerales bacterium]